MSWYELVGLAGKFAAPLAALIAVIGGAIAYRRQKGIDRFEDLVKKRREVYAGYVRIIQLNMFGVRDNIAYQEVYSSISIYGSDAVIRQVSEFHNEISDKADSIDIPRAAAAYASMITAMREDSFESSNLSPDEIKSLLPFK